VAVVTLASASPRRRELLARLLPDFQVLPADVDESLGGVASPAAVVVVAVRKARAVAERVGAGLVLGADTVVVVDDEALGKPGDPDQARAMLQRLRGRSHSVITGLVVLDAATGRTVTAAAVSQVLMRDYTDAAIDAYLATGEPFDKAGAYAVQGAGGELVAGWVGSYSNIVGLPLGEVRRLLTDFGVAVNPAIGSPA
jgi:septum formation protein